MAIEIERWQWRELFASEHGPADAGTRLVLFVIALHMNENGENAFPSQALVATRTGLSERSVRRHLAHAEKTGWLQRFERRRPGRAYFVSQYVATIPDHLAPLCSDKPWEIDPSWRRPANLAGCDGETVDKSPPKAEHPANGARRAANLAATPGKFGRDGRPPLPPNSSLNTSMNPSENVQSQATAPSPQKGFQRNQRNRSWRHPR